MRYPFRRRVHACIHPETFKYFLDPDEVSAVWQRLIVHVGPTRRVPGFGVLEASDERVLLRATERGNPITVIRKARCRPQDITELHRLLDYGEP